MATMKKAQDGAKTSATAKMAAAKGFKSIKDPDYKPSTKKYKNGGSLGMKSVKAGYDKNPSVTRADIITAAKGKAQNGTAIKQQNWKKDYDSKVKGVKGMSENEKVKKGITKLESVKKTMKSGGKIKKAQSGIMAKASKAISGAADTASKWIKSHQTGGAETERQRRISAKSGKSMKKCKTGCK